jgi:hypothetical protein
MRLDEAGVSDQVKEHRLGATTAVVEAVYTQATDPADRAAADLMAEVFRPSLMAALNVSGSTRCSQVLHLELQQKTVVARSRVASNSAIAFTPTSCAYESRRVPVIWLAPVLRRPGRWAPVALSATPIR